MDKFAAQLKQLQQKFHESEVQKCEAMEKLRKEFLEMKEAIIDAQQEYDTRAILRDITQKLIDCCEK